MRYLLLLSLLSTAAWSFPEAPFNALEKAVSPLGLKSIGHSFEAIVKLSNCSGSIIKFSGQPKESNAYVLTNGHCLEAGLLGPKEVVYNQPNKRKMKVSDKSMEFHNVQANTLLYATMYKTDAAIYILDQTYIELEGLGIRPFLLSSSKNLIGLPIDIVSGYWERGYSCYIEDQVFMLKEDKYEFFNSLRYSEFGCDIIGGTSGSPVIEKGERIVVAVNNTVNESGKRCLLNNPCEVDQDGQINVWSKRGYAQQTSQFYGCLTPDFKLDLNSPDCDLAK